MKIEMSMVNREKGEIALSFGTEEVSMAITLTKEDVKRVGELFSLAKMGGKK